MYSTRLFNLSICRFLNGQHDASEFYLLFIEKLVSSAEQSAGKDAAEAISFLMGIQLKQKVSFQIMQILSNS